VEPTGASDGPAPNANRRAREMTETNLDQHLPLTPVVFHTLLTLVEGQRHGYAIAQEVEERTGGRVKMGPGTLYGCLHRLSGLGYIQECDAPPYAAASERRRYYRLHDLGRSVLQAEARRLEADVHLLRVKNVLRGRRS